MESGDEMIKEQSIYKHVWRCIMCFNSRVTIRSLRALKIKSTKKYRRTGQSGRFRVIKIKHFIILCCVLHFWTSISLIHVYVLRGKIKLPYRKKQKLCSLLWRPRFNRGSIFIRSSAIMSLWNSQTTEGTKRGSREYPKKDFNA